MAIFKGGSIVKTIYQSDNPGLCMLSVCKGDERVFPGGYACYILHNKSTIIIPNGQNSTSAPNAGSGYEIPLYTAPASTDKTWDVLDSSWTMTGLTSYMKFSCTSTKTVTVNVAFQAVGGTARNVLCYALTSSDNGASWLARAMNTINLNTTWTSHSYSSSTFTLDAGHLLIPFAFYCETGGTAQWLPTDSVKHLVVQVT